MKNTSAILIYRNNVILIDKHGSTVVSVGRSEWASVVDLVNIDPTAYDLPEGYVIPSVVPDLPPGCDATYYDPISGESVAIVEGGDTYRFSSPFSFGDSLSKSFIVGSSYTTVIMAVAAAYVDYQNA